MMKSGKDLRSLGFGGFLCGGMAGLLFLLYPNSFPKHTTLHGIMLVGGFLGEAFHRLANTLIFKPVLFYTSFIQVRLLRRYIGEQTQSEIIKKLAMKYFLGDHHQDHDPPQ